MKKVLFGLLLFCSTSLFAQYDDDERTFHFGLGGTTSLPLGDLKSSTSYGVGFELQPSLSISENLEAFLQAGVVVFRGTSEGYYGYDAPSVLHIPLLAGARFRANGFVAGGGVGYGLFTSDGSKSNGFMYSPQVGYDFGRLEVTAHYTAASVPGGTLSYAGIKLFRKF